MLTGWEYAVGPVLGAAIGWTTNWLAIRMLFRPRREVRILGMRFCGLIPKRRTELTRRVAEIIEEELVTREDLRQVVESADLAPPILAVVEEHVDQFLAQQIDGLPKLVRRFISRDMVDRIKRGFMLEVESAVPRLTEGVIASIDSNVDFKRMVVERLDGIEIEKIESLVNRLARRELRSIELAGAVLGFLIGTVQSLWLWLAR